LKVSWVIPVPFGFIVKISSSPCGLVGVTRLLAKAILPLAPGKAASAGFASTSSIRPAANPADASSAKKALK
jgi:hypothetical protein